MGDLHKFDEYSIIWNYCTLKLLRHCSVNKIWNRINNNDKIVKVIIIILAKGQAPRKVLQLGTQPTRLEQRPCEARSEEGPELEKSVRYLLMVEIWPLSTCLTPTFTLSLAQPHRTTVSLETKSSL